MQTILLSDFSVFMSAMHCFCFFFSGYTFPTEVECSCTSSRKFPSRLQSAMTVWSVLSFLLVACSSLTDAPVGERERAGSSSATHRYQVYCLKEKMNKAS